MRDRPNQWKRATQSCKCAVSEKKSGLMKEEMLLSPGSVADVIEGRLLSS